MLYKNIDVDTLEALTKEYLTYSRMDLTYFDEFLDWIDANYASTSDLRNKAGRKTIAVDFDGVLHQYNTPIDLDEQHMIADPPVHGALEWVVEVLVDFDVVVYTARHVSHGGLEAVEEWLEHWGFPELPVTGTKPVARLYLDDRGVHFDGQNWPSIEYLKTFQPWNRKEGWARE